MSDTRVLVMQFVLGGIMAVGFFLAGHEKNPQLKLLLSLLSLVVALVLSVLLIGRSVEKPATSLTHELSPQTMVISNLLAGREVALDEWLETVYSGGLGRNAYKAARDLGVKEMFIVTNLNSWSRYRVRITHASNDTNVAHAEVGP